MDGASRKNERCRDPESERFVRTRAAIPAADEAPGDAANVGAAPEGRELFAEKRLLPNGKKYC